jgi:hypothetical protein
MPWANDKLFTTTPGGAQPACDAARLSFHCGRMESVPAADRIRLAARKPARYHIGNN